MAQLFRLLYNKFFPPPLPARDHFRGFTVVITGATGGLGLETAIHYVNLGASTVIITGRTLSKANAAKAVIEARTGRKDVVQVRELDMSTFSEVRKFVTGLIGKVKCIDIVLLNAGIYKSTYEQTPDGWEESLQVNTLSTILLGLLLLPWMQAAQSTNGRPQHLGIVSSGLHVMPNIQAATFPKEDVLQYWNERGNFRPGGGRDGSYSLSKLLMMYGADEVVRLARDREGTPLPIVNTMCPGVCKSDLGRQYAAKGAVVRALIWFFFATFAKSTENGARTLVLAAMTGPNEHGKYIRHYGTEEQYAEYVTPFYSSAAHSCKLKGKNFRKSARNRTSEVGKALQFEVWREMLEVFESAAPEVSNIVHPKP